MPMRIRIVLCIAFILVTSPVFSQFLETGKNSVDLLTDECVYDNNNHAAFTALESYNGALYLAFREGKGHVSQKGEEVIIKVMKKTRDKWDVNQTFTVNGGDLRDPFLMKWGNRLFMYAVGCYSELKETGWTPISTIQHNASHYLNIWKMREYKGVLYGIGNAHNKWPILLTSTDGVNWEVKEEFKLGGNATEADICFIKNKMYVCFRVEEPQGSMSYFGVSTYPFDDFKWSTIDASVASPELIAVSRKKMLLAGREYVYNNKEDKDGAYLSIFTINTKGEVLGRLRLDDDNTGDKGYPSFCFHNRKYYMSYYKGHGKASVHVIDFKVK